MKQLCFFLILLTASGVLLSHAQAADGKAYLRLINAASAKAINGIAGDVTFKGVNNFSPYFPLSPGDYEASVNKAKLSLELASGQQYSLVYYKQGKKKWLILLEDAPALDAGKALVLFYNFSDAPARLRATNFNTDLLGETLPMQAQPTEVDALGFDVAMTIDNVDVAHMAVTFERGQSYSFLLSGKLPKYQGVWVKNSRSKAE